MLISKEVFQEVVHLAPTCQGWCENCGIWKNPILYKASFQELIQEKRFFSVFRHYPVFNLIGGNPLDSVDNLSLITRYLSLFKKYMKLWIPCFFNHQTLDPFLPLLKEIWVFIPTSHLESLWAHTHQVGFEQVKKNMTILISKHQNVGICHHITPQSIQTLPELYEYAQSIRKPLLLHYDKNQAFSLESIQFIKRYRWVKGVHLYESTLPKTTYCQAYPYEALSDPKKVLQDSLCTKINQLRLKMGL